MDRGKDGFYLIYLVSVGHLLDFIPADFHNDIFSNAIWESG